MKATPGFPSPGTSYLIYLERWKKPQCKGREQTGSKQGNRKGKRETSWVPVNIPVPGSDLCLSQSCIPNSPQCLQINFSFLLTRERTQAVIEARNPSHRHRKKARQRLRDPSLRVNTWNQPCCLHLVLLI